MEVKFTVNWREVISGTLTGDRSIEGDRLIQGRLIQVWLYLWEFQRARTVRGESEEPVAIETELGQMGEACIAIALFSCYVTRAVHLELVEDLSAGTFRRCLRRFIAKRGMPVLIVSDIAKTFQVTEKALKKLFDYPEVKADLERDRIEWKFNSIRKGTLVGRIFRMNGCQCEGMPEENSRKREFDIRWIGNSVSWNRMYTQLKTIDVGIQWSGRRGFNTITLDLWRRIKTLPD